MENQFELLTEFQYSSEAFICRGKLESEGIDVFMRDQFTVDANPMMSNAVGGVKLYVKAEDLERAQAIIDSVSPFSVDDNGNLLRCPKCNAGQVEMRTSVRTKKAFGAFVVALLLGGLPYHVTYTYRCRNCQREYAEGI